ncbi:MAG: pilus assembly protein TadG-related protein [Gaiellaceae bacterium]
MIVSRLRDERGQAFVLACIALIVLLGMSAFVLDVGSWYRTQRRLQGTTDAAALAGAQLLPNDPSGGRSIAQSYATKNGGDVAGADIVITSKFQANDTISVRAARTDPGIFSKILNINSADISAKATARVGPPKEALHVAPMVVFCGHSLIKNCNNNHEPEFNVSTTLDYDDLGAPGAFGMLNLDGEQGTVGSSKEAEWILHGFDKYLPLGKYRSDPGAKFESDNLNDALDERIGTVLLFPVYETLDGEGQNAEYKIIGWIGFHLTGYEVHGHSATLEGYFTEYIAQGVLSQSAPGTGGVPSSLFGVKTIQLIE